MAKDDSFLYSGITSVSNEPKTPREIQRKEHEEIRIKLKPAYDVVIELLAVEKKALYDMRTLIFDTKTSEDEIRIERLLRMRHEALINKLELKLKTAMKEPKK